MLVQGPWSKDKLYFVEYFAALFNGGMKNLWANRAYIDLFAGPGICLDRTSNQEFEGSPLRALSCPLPFTELHFNDIQDDFLNALRMRQEFRFPGANVSYTAVDCNLAASKISNRLPTNALVLAFIDPWRYEITFNGLENLCQHPSMDLIVTFHGPAIKRNAHQQIAAVDSFLGGSEWRGPYESARGNVSQPPTVVLIDTFRSQLENRLGYTYFGEPAIIRNTTGSPKFYLLFASRHRRGLDFWEKSTLRFRSGQRTMF